MQVAGTAAVVLSFVTFEGRPPSEPPRASVSARGAAAATVVRGVTHAHTTAGGRTYYMHFVRLAGLAPRAEYGYAVRSGGAGAAWSRRFAFRAPYQSSTGGPTRIALYGDMARGQSPHPPLFASHPPSPSDRSHRVAGSP